MSRDANGRLTITHLLTAAILLVWLYCVGYGLLRATGAYSLHYGFGSWEVEYPGLFPGDEDSPIDIAIFCFYLPLWIADSCLLPYYAPYFLTEPTL